MLSAAEAQAVSKVEAARAVPEVVEEHPLPEAGPGPVRLVKWPAAAAVAVMRLLRGALRFF